MRTYALLGFLIGLIIVGILIYKAGTVYTRGTKESQTVAAPTVRANVLRCQTQIRKIEGAIQLYYVENSKYPERLEDLPGVQIQETFCPMTGNPYIYNPENGTVVCSEHR
ncbi:MAG: hypothetical protein ABIL20_00240 [candidate division WOR-3 bacterium]